VPHICPKTKHIRIATGMHILPLIEDEKAGNLAQVRVNTPLETAVRLLHCHNLKGKSSHYCDTFTNPSATKSICDNPTNYVFLHIFNTNISSSNSGDHLFAFISASKISVDMDTLVKELYDVASWLDIIHNEDLYYYLVQYEKPFFAQCSKRILLQT
jgi:hypothetical protein